MVDQQKYAHVESLQSDDAGRLWNEGVRDTWMNLDSSASAIQAFGVASNHRF